MISLYPPLYDIPLYPFLISLHTRMALNPPIGEIPSVALRLAVALICAPFAVRNLDDNVILQYLAA